MIPPPRDALELAVLLTVLPTAAVACAAGRAAAAGDAEAAAYLRAELVRREGRR